MYSKHLLLLDAQDLLAKFLDEPWPHPEWGPKDVQVILQWTIAKRAEGLWCPAAEALAVNLWLRTLQGLSPEEQRRAITVQECERVCRIASTLAESSEHKFARMVLCVLPDGRGDLDSEILSWMIWICKSFFVLRQAALLKGEESAATDEWFLRICESDRAHISYIYNLFDEVGGHRESPVWGGLRFKDPFAGRAGDADESAPA